MTMADIRTILGDRTNAPDIVDEDKKPKKKSPLKRKAKIDPSQRPLKFAKLQKNEEGGRMYMSSDAPSSDFASTSDFMEISMSSDLPELEEGLVLPAPARHPSLLAPRLLRQVASTPRNLTRRLTECNLFPLH